MILTAHFGKTDIFVQRAGRDFLAMIANLMFNWIHHSVCADMQHVSNVGSKFRCWKRDNYERAKKLGRGLIIPVFAQWFPIFSSVARCSHIAFSGFSLLGNHSISCGMAPVSKKNTFSGGNHFHKIHTYVVSCSIFYIMNYQQYLQLIFLSA